MTLSVAGFILAAALLVGGGSQLVGRRRERYEWEVGTVGALYGALLANGLLVARVSPGSDFDGLVIAAVLVGAVLGGGLLVLGVRAFGSPISSGRRARSPAAALVVSHIVKLTFSPVLIEQPIVDRMRRQFGVTATVRRVEVQGDMGWIDLQVVGVEPAVESAISLAQHAGIALVDEAAERVPTLAA